MKKIIRRLIITILFALGLFYFMLPAINLKSQSFYIYLICVAAVYLLLTLVGKMGVSQLSYMKLDKSLLKMGIKIPLIIVAIGAVILIGGELFSQPFFHAASYQKLMPVEEREFSEDITRISQNEVPIVDKDSAKRLGNRKLGELVELVSQFEVDESEYSYTQINYNGVPTRVAPLQYGDLIKWFNNQSQGIPGYISVDMASQNVTLVQLEQGIKYSPGELFFRNLDRHLRINYPTYMFGEYCFEVDDEGNPFWICPVIDHTIGIFGGKDIKGVVILNAQTGSSTYHPIGNVPNWVDQAYSADIVVSQIDYWGEYINGFWNTIFGQKNVRTSSDGYNYLAMEDDVWLYTGVTSVGNDQSNIGFILVNMRTKEARHYIVSGATEYSAMGSAEGQVQHLAYNATFPLLLNIGNQPTYFISLKDNAGLVKKFAYVNVEKYQMVGIGDTLDEAYVEYLKALAEDSEIDTASLESITGEVEAVTSAVKEGNTYYYIQLKNSDKIFTASIQLSDVLAILTEDDKVTIGYMETSDIFTTINEIELVK